MVGDELRSLTASGEKLFCSLVALPWILVYLSPDGCSMKTLWVGWVLSSIILPLPLFLPCWDSTTLCFNSLCTTLSHLYTQAGYGLPEQFPQFQQ